MATAKLAATKPASKQGASGTAAPRTAKAQKNVGELVRWVRGDARSPLPHRELVEQLFGRSFDSVEAYRGSRAAEACDALDARAFAVGRVIAFADARPALPSVVHELAHVVQHEAQGLRPLVADLPIAAPTSEAERQAGAVARGASPRVLTAAPFALHREADLDDTDEETLTKPLLKRLYAVMKLAATGDGSLIPNIDRRTADNAVVGVRDKSWFSPIFGRSSVAPWTSGAYAKAAAAKASVASTDLKDALEKPKDQTRPSPAEEGFVIGRRRIRLVQVSDSAKDKKNEPREFAFVGDSDVNDVIASWQARVQDMRADLRMRKFAEKSEYALTNLTAKPKFGTRETGKKKPSETILNSSKETFTVDQYVAFHAPADDKAKAEVRADIELFRGEKGETHRSVPWGTTGRAYLAEVLHNEGKNVHKWALIDQDKDRVQFADPAGEREKSDPAGILADYKATFLKGVREINSGTYKEKLGGKPAEPIDNAAALLSDLDAIDKTLDLALAEIEKAKADPTYPQPLQSKLTELAEISRRAFVDAVVKHYDDVSKLHLHLGVSKIFRKPKAGKDDEGANFEKIRGTIFEEWVHKRFPNIETDPEHVPVFGKRDGDKLQKSEALQKLRRGDGKIVTKDHKQFIFEAKFVTTEPTDEHKAQMVDYAQILGWDGKTLGNPLPGYFYNSKAKPEERWVEVKKWAGVLYVFSSQEQKDGWLEPIKKAFGDLYPKQVQTVFAGDPNAKEIITTFVENPTVELKIKDPGERTSFTFPPFDNPEPKIPGVKFESIQIELAGPGDPLIKKGTVTTSLDPTALKGVVSSEKPAARPIQPISESERIDQLGKKTSSKKPLVYGRVTEKIGGLKSKLDELLKRVKTSARLIDGGVEASIDVEPGTSGIPGFNLTEAGVTVTLGKSVKHGFAIDGRIGLAHKSGKIAGSLKVSYDGGLVIKGSATVKDLIEGVKPFTVDVTYAAPTEEGGEAKIDVESKEGIKFEKRYRGVYITGAATNLKYDVKESSFSADANLTADLGPFGTASVKDVHIVNNKLDSATFSYESKELKWPKKNPTLAMQVEGHATYDKGEFSGGLGVTATITHKALKRLNPQLDNIKLEGHVDIAKDGRTSGSIETKSVIPLGKHFQIPSLLIKVTPEGEVSASFTVDLINIESTWVKLEDASLSAVIDRDGFRVTKGRLSLDVGAKGKKFHGKLVVDYDPSEGFSLDARVDFEVKPGLIAEGRLTYSSKTQKVNAKLSTAKPITLLDKSGSTNLFSLDKQIRIFGIPFVIGLYLDLGINLTFNYGFSLTVAPSIELEEFSLETFKFKEARATMTLGGELWASLEPTPRLGLGGYLIDPIVLRGGGGIRIPISAKARLLPSGTVVAIYNPEGGLKGGASIGLALRFGITAAVEPYADFVLLSGLYTAEWKGNPIASFVILPERELFSFTFDFGQPIKKQEPDVPEKQTSREAVEPKATKSVGTTAQEGSKAVPDQPKADRPGVDPHNVKDEEAGAQEGFNFKQLIDKMLSTGPGKSIKEVFETVKEVYEFIKGIVGKIWKAIKGFIGDAIDVFKSFLEGIKNGPFKYIKKILKEHLNETLFYVIEPVLDVFVDEEDKIIDMFVNAPKDPFDLVLHIVKSLFEVAWDGLTSLVKAIKTMFGRGKTAIGRWLDYLVKEGKLGVLRREYYVGSETLGLAHYFLAPDQYKIHVGVNSSGKNGGSTLLGVDSGIAIGLWLALEMFSEVSYTKNPQVGSHDNYWTGPVDED